MQKNNTGTARAEAWTHAFWKVHRGDEKAMGEWSNSWTKEKAEIVCTHASAHQSNTDLVR
jgi:hypothetical protein